MRRRGATGVAIAVVAAVCAVGAGGASASSTAAAEGRPTASAWSPTRGAAETAWAPLPGGRGNAAAAAIAMQFQGVPYVWGGASPAGFDCSGLPAYAYAQVGISVPHYTVAIWNAFPQVPSDRLQAGDLVFFHDLGHMGIYIGGGRFVHSPHTGDVVKVSDLGTYSGYVGAVRPG